MSAVYITDVLNEKRGTPMRDREELLDASYFFKIVFLLDDTSQCSTARLTRETGQPLPTFSTLHILSLTITITIMYSAIEPMGNGAI